MTAQITQPPQAPASLPRSSSTAIRLLRRLAESPEAGVVLACVVVFIVISANASTYASAGNLQVMGRDLSQTGILAIGESLVILTGGIDLSVGALAGLAGIIAAWFNVNQGLPAVPAIIITLIICAAVGYWHGSMVTRLNVPPFVITLVTYTTAQGLSLAITTGSPINGLSGLFSKVSSAYLWQIPVPGIIFAAAAVIAWFVLERTYVGRQIYAVGGNREAARLAGIPIRKRIVSTYITSAVLAGLVGMLTIGRMNVADPSVGPGWELIAIAAAVVGGVSLFGGEGRMLGVAAGAILLDRLRASYFGRGRR